MGANVEPFGDFVIGSPKPDNGRRYLDDDEGRNHRPDNSGDNAGPLGYKLPAKTYPFGKPAAAENGDCEYSGQHGAQHAADAMDGEYVKGIVDFPA